MIRKPYVAGQFYPADKKSLEDMLSSLTVSDVPAVPKSRVKGLILPHAGYIYSGAVVGLTVSGLQIAQTVVILGPNHTGLGAPYSVMTQGAWQTPLGTMDIHSGLAENIVHGSKYLKSDTLAHNSEHSIEVLLPFLQYTGQKMQFVPIVIMQSERRVYQSIAEDIYRAIADLHLENNITVIASSDMTHYEPQESAEKKDRYAIDAIAKLDCETLLKRVDEKNISMCGIAPVSVMIEVVKLLGAQKASLVKYQTSGDTTGDFSSVVGYAGMRVN